MKHSNHQFSQARSYTQAIAEIFYISMASRSPLDQELRKYFRIQKKCGSRDRRFISEALFSLFRWYGWIKPLMPTSAPVKALESKTFCSAISAVLYLDKHNNNPVANFIAERVDINAERMPIPGLTIEDKKNWLGRHFGLKQLKLEALVPEWFKDELPKGFDLPSLIETLQVRPPMWIRLQGDDAKNKTVEELKSHKLNPEVHSIMKKSVKLINPRVNLYELDSFRSGQFEVQDLASQALGFACQAKAGERWWDVCAGAGGKTMLLADHMKSKGTLIATDIREWKLEDLKKRARRAGFSNITTKGLKKGRATSKKHTFDGVLVDAPCSCTGTWRRNPDARWNSTENDCIELAEIQKDILSKAVSSVKDGGVLVYATCSFSVKENEEIVDYVLKNHPEFSLEDFPHPLTGEPTNGIMRISPSPEDCDAMFAARFRYKAVTS